MLLSQMRSGTGLERNGFEEMNENKSSGIGFAGLLTIVFIILKLTKVITWSWWWVVSPIWISTGLVLVVLIVMAIINASINRRYFK